MKHVERELERLNADGRRFLCRGAQNQNVSEVLEKIEQSRRASEHAANRHQEMADAGIEGQAGDAEIRRRQAQGMKDLWDVVRGQVDELSAAGLEVRTGSIVIRLINAGERRLAQTVDKISRDRCNADLTPVIAALPRPCEQAEYVCPKCGRVGHVTKTADATEEAA